MADSSSVITAQYRQAQTIQPLVLKSLVLHCALHPAIFQMVATLALATPTIGDAWLMSNPGYLAVILTSSASKIILALVFAEKYCSD